MKIELDNIYNMDCLEGMRAIPDGSIDCIVTSPPYDTMRLYGGVAEGWTFEKFKAIAAELARVLKDGGAMVWVVGDETLNHSESGNSFRQALHFMDIGLKLQDTMIFQKKNPFPGFRPTVYQQAFEYMFVLTKGVLTTFNPITVETQSRPTTYNKVNKWARESGKWNTKRRVEITKSYKNHSNIWEYAVGGKRGSDFHPAVFPLQLAVDMIYSYSNEGDKVLDPFMGSGTTAIAAIREKRHFIGFELNKEYFEKTQQRISSERQQLSLF